MLFGCQHSLRHIFHGMGSVSSTNVLNSNLHPQKLDYLQVNTDQALTLKVHSIRTDKQKTLLNFKFTILQLTGQFKHLTAWQC